MARTFKRQKVWFKDEAPAIGSGIRYVEVFEGRKWVYLRPLPRPEMQGPKRVRAKIKAAVWRGMMQSPGNRTLTAGVTQ